MKPDQTPLGLTKFVSISFDAVLRSHYVRFLGGGIICSIINNIILIAGDYFGFSYLYLIFVCYLTSGTAGYWFHSQITFQNEMTLKGYLCFICGISLGLPISLIILVILCDYVALPMLIAAPVMTVLMIAYHYGAARLAITRTNAVSTK